MGANCETRLPPDVEDEELPLPLPEPLPMNVDLDIVPRQASTLLISQQSHAPLSIC